MRLARTSVVYFLSDVLTSVVGFVATLYFARKLGSAPLGKYFLVVALVGWLSIPPHGVGEAISKRMSEEVDQGAILTAGFAMNGLLALLILGSVLLFRARINAYIGAPVALLFGGLFCGRVFFDSVQQALSGQHLVAHKGLLKTFDQFLRAIVQVGLVVGGYSVLALVGGELIAVFVSIAVGLLLFRVWFEFPDPDHFRRLFEYARYSWLSNVKARAFGWMDTIILSLFVGPGLIGIYEVSWRLGAVLVLLSKAVHQTLFPEMSRINAEGETEELMDLLDEGLFAAGIFVIPGLIGALILGEKILRIYGPEFVEGAIVLPILVFALAVDAYGSQFETLVNAFDRPDLMFRVNLVFVAANLGLNVVLISTLGFVGAAIATATSASIALVLGYYFTTTRIGTPDLPVGDIGRQVVAGLTMGVSILVVRRLFLWSNMYATVGLVFLGATIYFLVLAAISRRFRQKAIGVLPMRLERFRWLR